MNNTARENIRVRLEAALYKEVLTVSRGAEILGISRPQISWIKNPPLWCNLVDSPWEKVLAWVNSGQTLVEWEKKHGHVLPQEKGSVKIKHETKLLNEIMKEPQPEAIPKADITDEPWLNDLPDDPRIKIIPGVLGMRQQDFAWRRMSNGELIDALLREKALLQEKIDAIDVLLKHYIS